MRDTDAGLDLVHILPALAPAPHGVPFKITGVHLKLRCFRFGEGRNGNRTRLHPVPLLGRWHTLPAMTTRLISENPLRASARDPQYDKTSLLLYDLKLKDPSAMPRGRRLSSAPPLGALHPRRLLLL